jgi:hypothetical protein
MTRTPLTQLDLQRNSVALATAMQRDFRPTSYLTEQDDRGNSRAAEAMVSAFIFARADCNLKY